MDLAFFFNVCGDEPLAIRLVDQIRSFYPSSEILIIGDGAIANEAVIPMRKAGAVVVNDRRLKPKGTSEFTKRNLRLILEHTTANLVIKIDPDTILQRPFTHFPDAEWFGKLVRVRWFSDQIEVLAVHGSCWGMQRSLIERLHDSEVLDDLNHRYGDPKNISLKHGTPVPFEDPCIALAVKAVGVTPVKWGEVFHSYDREPPKDLSYATIHPCREESSAGLQDVKRSWNATQTRQMAISATVDCPVGCSYCPNPSHQKEYNGSRFMSRLDFEFFLSKIPKSVAIGFTGFSEVFLNPDAIEMASIAASSGYKVHAYSTLFGLSLDDLDRLRAIPFSRFSIHMPDKNMNVRLIDRPGHSSVIESAIKSPICENQFLLNLGTPTNADWQGTGFSDWRGAVYSRAGNLPSQAKEIKAGQRFACTQRRQYMNVLLPNGDVSLCCSDFSLKHVIGNLHNESYRELFQGRAFRKILDAMDGSCDETICRKCEIAAIRGY